MKLLSLLVLLLLSACAGREALLLPELQKAEISTGQREEILQECEGIFVSGNWQLVHSITFSMASGHGATVIGVTIFDENTLRTGLMSVEGFVLFEAERDTAGELQVMRALPPFDNMEFARGLMRDVQMLFVRPAAAPVVALLGNEGLGCRYEANDGSSVDIVPIADSGAVVHVYDRASTEKLSFEMTDFRKTATGQFPQKIYLKTPGIQGYTLNMTLISAEKTEE